MEYVYKSPKLLESQENDLCPGCMQGIAIKTIYELIEEMEINDYQVLPLGVACPENAIGWGEFTFQKPAYGAGSMSAGIKRMNPDKIIIIFQGDNGAGSAAISDTVHTANRGDSITVISINNLYSGMQKPSFGIPSGFSYQDSGFQGMHAPSLNNLGDNMNMQGSGMKTVEIIAALPNAAFVARVSVHNPKEILKTKAAIKKGLEIQIDNAGYSFIEILCPCHVNLDIDACDISDYFEENTIKDYPLGIMKSV